MTTRPVREAYNALNRHTGVVIPVHLPAQLDVSRAATLLHDTVFALHREIANPRAICLSVDGPGPAIPVVESLANEFGIQWVSSPLNRGKLGAVRLGMDRLLAEDGLTCFATVDQDGDHFANELISFVRAARYVQQVADTDSVLVLGRRISRHRPMGFLRGELEELADRMLLDALAYDASVRGSPLQMEFSNTLDEFPDFHSGYKLFTRAAAQSVFRAEPRMAGASDDCYYRHAVEAVMTVEALQSGARLAVVNRSTLDGQPVSAFGLLNRRRMVADKIIWPCRRLNVPGQFVAQWFRNHLPGLLLGTLTPEGKQELLDIRAMTLEAFDPALLTAGDARDILRLEFL
jgi:hypothetical protein